MLLLLSIIHQTGSGQEVDCSSIPDGNIPIVLVHGLVKNRKDMNKLRDLILADYPDR